MRQFMCMPTASQTYTALSRDSANKRLSTMAKNFPSKLERDIQTMNNGALILFIYI